MPSDIGKFIVGGVFVAASFWLPGAIGLGAAAGGLTAGGTALQLAMLTAGTGLLNASLQPNAGQGIVAQLDTTATLNPLPVVYGGAVLPLRIVDIRIDPANRKDLWIVGAICHGSENGQGIQQINQIWFDNVLAVDSSGVVQPFFSGKLQFAKFLGTDAQNVAANTGYQTTGTGSTLSTTLNAVFGNSVWPTGTGKDSKGVGIACVVLRLTYDAQVYNGIPNITVQATGNKVYDPRTAFPRSNNAGWSYTENPALCIADYLLSARYGMKLGTAEVDCGTAGSDTTTSFRNMAQFCDQAVALPTPPGGTQNRFSCDGAIDVSQPPLENLRQLLSACRGALFWEAGQARLAIRDVATPVSLVLDENVIVGDWSFRVPGATEAPNIVTTSYPDHALLNNQPNVVQWPNPGGTNSYLTADNGFEVGLDIQLPFTVDRFMAEQIAMVTLKEQRSALPVQVTCKEAALQLRVGDVVNVTHVTPGWTLKPFWVTEIVFDPALSLVRLSLVAYDANAYSLDTQVLFPSPPATGLPDPSTCLPPTGVTLLSDATTAKRLPDGSMVDQVLVSWTPPVDPFLNHYLIFAGPVGGTITTTLAVKGDTSQMVGPFGADTQIQVQMVAVNQLGRVSALAPASVVTVNTPVLGVAAGDNKLVNGNAQIGSVGVQAPNWNFVSGAALLVASDWSIAGDRSLKMVNAGAGGMSSQTITVQTGDVIRIIGSIKTNGALAGTDHGVIQVAQLATATFTVLDTQASYASLAAANNQYIGTAVNGVEVVQMTLWVTLGGTFSVNLRIVGGGTTGTVWWDDLRVQTLPPSVTRGAARGYTGLTDTGWIQPGSGQLDTISGRTLVRGKQSGTALNGDAISFTPVFPNTPAIRIWGGITREPRSKWGATGSGSETSAPLATTPEYEDFIAENPSASGFTMRARLKQQSTGQTLVTDTFAAGSVVNVGDTKEVTLASGPAADNKYTITVGGSIAATAPSNGFADAEAALNVTLAIESWDGTTWTQRAQKTYQADAIGSGVTQTVSIGDTWVLTVTGLTSSSKFRIRITAKTVWTTSGGSTTTAITGGTAKFYTAAGTVQYASKTPDTGQTVFWEADYSG